MLKRILLGLGGTPYTDMIVMGNSIRNLLLRHLLGDTVLNTILTTDRPLFLAQ